MTHLVVSEASLNKNFKEIKSTAGSYNQITKKNIASSADESTNHAIDLEIGEKIPMTKSSDFNEVLPESYIELEGSYPKKEIQNSNETRKVNASVINGNEQLSENRNTNTKRAPQKPLTSKSLPNDPLKNVVILGDGIVKSINGWEISRKLKNCRVKIMSFSGATVQCVNDYVKPSLCDKPTHLILHVRSNDLNCSKTAESIATSIVEQVITIKDDRHDVSVSNIVIRKDHLKKKAEEVNSCLKELCMKKNIFLIDHSKSIR